MAPKKKTEIYEELLQKTLAELKDINNPESVSRELPTLITYIEALAANPYLTIDSLSSSLVRELRGLTTQKTKLVDDVVRAQEKVANLEQTNKTLTDRVKERSRELASLVSDYTSRFAEREKLLDERTAELGAKEADLSLREQELVLEKRNVRIMKDASEKELASARKEMVDAKDLNQQTAAHALRVNAKLEKLKPEEEKLEEKRREVLICEKNLKASENIIKGKKDELRRKEEELNKKAIDANKLIQRGREVDMEHKLVQANIKKSKDELDKKEFSLIRREDGINKLVENMKQRHGLNGLANWDDELAEVVNNSNLYRESIEAIKGLLTLVKKHGITDTEIEDAYKNISGKEMLNVLKKL